MFSLYLLAKTKEEEKLHFLVPKVSCPQNLMSSKSHVPKVFVLIVPSIVLLSAASHIVCSRTWFSQDCITVPYWWTRKCWMTKCCKIGPVPYSEIVRLFSLLAQKCDHCWLSHLAQIALPSPFSWIVNSWIWRRQCYLIWAALQDSFWKELRSVWFWLGTILWMRVG